MSTYNQAPLWTDPWLKTGYRGTVVVLEAVPDKPDQVKGAITCRQYYYRFFLTNTNYSNWFDIAEIVVRSDYADIPMGVPSAAVTTYQTSEYSMERLLCSSAAGAFWSNYYYPHGLKINDIIIGFGFDYCIETGAHADSYIEAHLRVHSSSNPRAAGVVLGTHTANAQGASYVHEYKALATPYTIPDGAGLCSRAIRYQKLGIDPGAYFWFRAPFVRVAIPY